MRTLSTKAVIFMLVLTFVMPAAQAFGQGRKETSAPVARMVPADQAASAAAFRASLSTAVAKVVAMDQQPGGQGATKPKGIRAQMGGGGGKGPMIMMLVSTVIGLVTTVWMIKYIQKQQKEPEGGV